MCQIVCSFWQMDPIWPGTGYSKPSAGGGVPEIDFPKGDGLLPVRARTRGSDYNWGVWISREPLPALFVRVHFTVDQQSKLLYGPRGRACPTGENILEF